MFDSVEEAEAIRQRLVTEIHTIQDQLSERNRTDRSGQRLGGQEYWNWRKAAQHSLTTKLSELRVVKEWLRGQRSSQAPRGDMRRLARDLYDMVVRLSIAGHVQLDESARALLVGAGEQLADRD